MLTKPLNETGDGNAGGARADEDRDEEVLLLRLYYCYQGSSKALVRL